MMRRAGAVVAGALSLALGGPLRAETLRGYVWEIRGSALVVEERSVELLPSTRIERSGEGRISAAALRGGWEVEIEGKTVEPGVLAARRIKVLTKRSSPISVEGAVEATAEGALYVEGWPIRWPGGLAREEVRTGMKLKGEGSLLDDGTVTLSHWKLEPAREDPGERKYLDEVGPGLAALRNRLVSGPRSPLQEYVGRVGRRVAQQAHGLPPGGLSFYVVGDRDPNAFALPDGTVVVHYGLLTVLHNEAQLASVLGHEIAHVTHAHAYRSHKARRLGRFASVAGRVGQIALGRGRAVAGLFVRLGSNLATSAAVNGYGRELEDEADRVGLRYAYLAGYDPFESIEVWRLLSKRAGSQSRVGNWFFGDHSTHRARISNLTREINLRYRTATRPGALERNEEAYRRAVTGRDRGGAPVRSAPPRDAGPGASAGSVAPDTSQATKEGVSLDRYAATVVALLRPGAVPEHVLRANGFTDAARWERVSKAWTDAISQDPSIARQYAEAFQRYAGAPFETDEQQ